MLRVLRNLCLCSLLALALTACGSGEDLPRLAPDATILAFGDSLTHGTGASPEDSYPSHLQTLTAREVVRAGIPGERSEAGRARLPGVLDEHDPDLLILMHGGNDILQRGDMDSLRDNLAAMIEEAQDRGIAVLLVAVPEPALPPRPPALYSEVADEYGIPYEDRVMARIIRNSDLRSDSVHPNARGYRKMAEAIEQALQDAGAL